MFRRAVLLGVIALGQVGARAQAGDDDARDYFADWAVLNEVRSACITSTQAAYEALNRRGLGVWKDATLKFGNGKLLPGGKLLWTKGNTRALSCDQSQPWVTCPSLSGSTDECSCWGLTFEVGQANANAKTKAKACADQEANQVNEIDPRRAEFLLRPPAKGRAQPSAIDSRNHNPFVISNLKDAPPPLSWPSPSAAEITVMTTTTSSLCPAGILPAFEATCKRLGRAVAQARFLRAWDRRIAAIDEVEVCQNKVYAAAVQALYPSGAQAIRDEYWANLRTTCFESQLRAITPTATNAEAVIGPCLTSTSEEARILAGTFRPGAVSTVALVEQRAAEVPPAIDPEIEQRFWEQQFAGAESLASTRYFVGRALAAAERGPNPESAQNTRLLQGKIDLALGRPRQAMESWKRALADHPSAQPAYLLAVLSLVHGNRQAAAQYSALADANAETAPDQLASDFISAAIALEGHRSAETAIAVSEAWQRVAVAQAEEPDLYVDLLPVAIRAVQADVHRDLTIAVGDPGLACPVLERDLQDPEYFPSVDPLWACVRSATAPVKANRKIPDLRTKLVLFEAAMRALGAYLRREGNRPGALKDSLFAALQLQAAQWGHVKAANFPKDKDELYRMLTKKVPTGVVVTFLRPSREGMLAIVARSDEDLELVKLSATGLDAELAEWKALVAAGSPRADRVGQRVYRRLFAPLEPHLASGSTQVVPLWVVVEGSLATVPWYALWDGGQHLVDRFEIATAPSLGHLNLASPSGWQEPHVIADAVNPALEDPSSGRTRGLRSVRGYPPLPAALEEAEALHAQFNKGEIFTQDDATPNRLNDPQQDPWLVHVATHGDLRMSVPCRAENFLVLSAPDSARPCEGLVSAAAIRERANIAGTDLVTLSACDSAATDATNPGGGDNLPTAFLGRCARSVLAALWPIDDEATRDLMAAFYLGLTLTDRTREWALREAILRIREERRFPREWAPFVLVGAPGLVQGAQTP